MNTIYHILSKNPSSLSIFMMLLGSTHLVTVLFIMSLEAFSLPSPQKLIIHNIHFLESCVVKLVINRTLSSNVYEVNLKF